MSTLAFSEFDKSAVKAEMTKILISIKRNNCSADIVLKDISTVNGNPYNPIEWHNTAIETINEIF